MEFKDIDGKVTNWNFKLDRHPRSVERGWRKKYSAKNPVALGFTKTAVPPRPMLTEFRSPTAAEVFAVH